eukprot:CCRYP_008674-RB/>CCRYP_008674-RB protein AED:0.16 eAED:0.16 QI:143/1/1/1/0.75/0.6/5/454/617
MIVHRRATCLYASIPCILPIMLLMSLSIISISLSTAADEPHRKKNLVSKILGRFTKHEKDGADNLQEVIPTIIDEVVIANRIDKATDDYVCTYSNDAKVCSAKNPQAQVNNQNDLDEKDVPNQDTTRQDAIDDPLNDNPSHENVDTTSLIMQHDWEQTTKQNPCQDLHPNCATWSIQFDPTNNSTPCTTNSAFMSHYCAQSCDACELAHLGRQLSEMSDGHVPSFCSDDAYDCSKWAAGGECQRNPDYMREMCRKSCGICSEESNYFGAGQRLPREKKQDIAMTEQRIDETIKYMKMVKKHRDYSRVRSKCLNRNQDCTYWWTLGECTINPEYMNMFCAPACQTCHLFEGYGPKCQGLPKSEPLWKPGDLNAFFERVVDNSDGTGEFLKYNPRALSRPKLKSDGTPSPGNMEVEGPWVVSLDKFITNDEADRIVEIANQQGFKRSGRVEGPSAGSPIGVGVTDARTSHNTWCQEESCTKDPVVSRVLERIATVTNSTIDHSEHLQILRYETGQFYTIHNDYIHMQRDMPCGSRILTLFMYLNDVEEGGETRFPLLDVVVEARKGSALMWPNVEDADPDEKDQRTDHEAMPVVKGVKFGANAWIHSEDFKAPFYMNCL